jgi:hypothetical protein
MAGKIVAGIIGGFIVAALAGNIATLVSGSKGASVVALLLAWAVAITGAVKASRAAKAWRWLLVTSAALSFVVPLATLIRTTKETTGAGALGGLVATGIFSVVFFLLGSAFLVIGLLVGRDKQAGT